MNDTRLHELMQEYALRTREFSNVVARLGQFNNVGAALLDAMEEIEELRSVCMGAGNELNRYIEANRESPTETEDHVVFRRPRPWDRQRRGHGLR
jgi:hypothetical protein